MPADPDRPAPDTAPLTSDAPAPDAAPDRPGCAAWSPGAGRLSWRSSWSLPAWPTGRHRRRSKPSPRRCSLLPLWYLVITATGRRSWTWPVLVVGIAAFVLLRMQERVEPAVVLLATALVAVLWGAVRGGLGRPSFLLQVSGLVAYGGLALAGLVLAPRWAGTSSPRAGSGTACGTSPTRAQTPECRDQARSGAAWSTS